MKVWKHSRHDAWMLLFTLAHGAITVWTAFHWNAASDLARAGSVALLAAMMTYNIIVVAHLFTHTPWFTSSRLNGLVSMLNSFSIGQSVQVYQLAHVRNHHRHNNDRKGPDGLTADRSSTYRDGEEGEHAPLWRYALGGACDSMVDMAKALASAARLCRRAPVEPHLAALAARDEPRRSRELDQVRRDRLFHAAALLACTIVSPSWLTMCYLPALCVAFALVNVQNYYEHFGADPRSRYTDSVSYYGRLYNLLTFNDGYHQEHHLRPQAHWRDMPGIRIRHAELLSSLPRVVSPVPALLGFLHRSRPLLHRAAPPLELGRPRPATSPLDRA
ncbi:fatty acid desaturase [Paraburkholderia sp. A1RI_3L]|uniref:fatty acid desaturase family protein n=1 Tax=Paraburkholderia TaxID=1822464 RepID=UPI003B825CA7